MAEGKNKGKEKLTQQDIRNAFECVYARLFQNKTLWELPAEQRKSNDRWLYNLSKKKMREYEAAGWRLDWALEELAKSRQITAEQRKRYYEGKEALADYLAANRASHLPGIPRWLRIANNGAAETARMLGVMHPFAHSEIVAAVSYLDAYRNLKHGYDRASGTEREVLGRYLRELEKAPPSKRAIYQPKKQKVAAKNKPVHRRLRA